MDHGGHKLEEIAKAAGVSPRTVRYYIQRGLLPQPSFRGPDTAYGHEHVVRLRAIRRLQDAYWPLDAIGGLFASKSEREIEAIADGSNVPTPTGAAPTLSAPTPAKRVRPPAVSERTTLVRRIQLTDELVLEVLSRASDETDALVEAIRTLVTKRR
jgi:Ca-activated chloride channel family protein